MTDVAFALGDGEYATTGSVVATEDGSRWVVSPLAPGWPTIDQDYQTGEYVVYVRSEDGSRITRFPAKKLVLVDPGPRARHA